MANITINEVSQNYTYNIGTNSYAAVALPITASWGPAFMDPQSTGSSVDEMLENTVFERFPATQAGMESFVATYRGPAANYRLAKDYSYQMAMTLLSAGYDVLVCRLCPGTAATGTFSVGESGQVTVTAKYPGTFGNNLRVNLVKVPNRDYWNLVTYVVDASGVQTAVENIVFVFNVANSTDSVLHVDEVESNFVKVAATGTIDDTAEYDPQTTLLSGGADKPAWDATEGSTVTGASILAEALNLAKARYENAGYPEAEFTASPYYTEGFQVRQSDSSLDELTASIIYYNEWLYTYACRVYDLLKDKLAYNPQRVISPGWDDQNVSAISGEPFTGKLTTLSPLHLKLMDVGYYSRCATALLDIPKCLPRSKVYNEATGEAEGYAQMLARYEPPNAAYDINATLYHTHSALFAPWGQYKYVGTNKLNPASPSFQALMIQRAMILNQSAQYEWALPTNRKHNLALGTLDYKVSKKLLDEWQKLEGVGVNVITQIPDLGTSLWGNSTLYEVPPATYQALSNLSTRYLVNAVENVAYRCGVSITFQYNNEQAYNKFYAGVTPTLDTMKNVGAIDDYYVRMAADINGLDQVNANTVIGKIYLVVNGVINDIIVDLIALPPGTDLNQFKS